MGRARLDGGSIAARTTVNPTLCPGVTVTSLSPIVATPPEPLLLGFALVAGFATCLSPCALPVLPAVLSGGATGGRRRPLGIVTGRVASFTFATVALVYVIAALGLPNDLMRTFAVVVLLVFGLFLLVPARPRASRRG